LYALDHMPEEVRFRGSWAAPDGIRRRAVLRLPTSADPERGRALTQAERDQLLVLARGRKHPAAAATLLRVDPCEVSRAHLAAVLGSYEVIQ
jgi:hypothetical protein